MSDFLINEFSHTKGKFTIDTRYFSRFIAEGGYTECGKGGYAEWGRKGLCVMGQKGAMGNGEDGSSADSGTECLT